MNCHSEGGKETLDFSKLQEEKFGGKKKNLIKKKSSLTNLILDQRSFKNQGRENKTVSTDRAKKKILSQIGFCQF